MNTIARILLFLLLASASAVALATDRKGNAGEVRTETSSRSTTAPAVTTPPAVQEQKSPETRKPKRCRNQYKTVGIACKKRTSR